MYVQLGISTTGKKESLQKLGRMSFLSERVSLKSSDSVTSMTVDRLSFEDANGASCIGRPEFVEYAVLDVA